MDKDRDRKNNDRKEDTFDRTYIGKPGFMIIIVLLIILISLIANYFN